MSDKKCPACGSEDLVETRSVKTIKEAFGGSTNIPLTEYTCNVCASNGDFFSENEGAIQAALYEIKKTAVTNILNDFTENKISLSSMERALELPQRTLAKWKSGVAKPSSSGVALLKFVRLFPWMLEVAENKYDYVTAQRVHMNSAFEKILHCMKFDRNDFAEAGLVTTAKSAFLYMNFIKSDEEESGSTSYIENKPEIIDVSWSNV